MKMIDLTTEEAANNAYNEPNMLERLQHPNIVQFYETFVVKDVLYLVMEYCEEGIVIFLERKWLNSYNRRFTE